MGRRTVNGPQTQLEMRFDIASNIDSPMREDLATPEPT